MGKTHPSTSTLVRLVKKFVVFFQRIEHLLGKKLPKYTTEESEVMAFSERVAEAQRFAKMEIKDLEEKKSYGKRRRKAGDEFEDGEQFVGVRKRVGGKDNSGPGGKKKRKR